jgi:tetratricopeptide (TPR) repeat protein
MSFREAKVKRARNGDNHTPLRVRTHLKKDGPNKSCETVASAGERSHRRAAADGALAVTLRSRRAPASHPAVGVIIPPRGPRYVGRDPNEAQLHMTSDHDVLAAASDLMRVRRYADAFELLEPATATLSPNWNALYLAGQCRRFLDDFDGAVDLLQRAADAAPSVAVVYLALGIALQLRGSLEEASGALVRAIEIDADYALAFNSLAMTQQLKGDLDQAAHNYDAGCKALARRIIKGMRNDRRNRIFKHRDTRGTLWTDYTMYAASAQVAADHTIQGTAWLTAELAAEEERTETRGGLYWEDTTDKDGHAVRLFLPNYVNTFRESLKQDSTYSNLLGNRSAVLDLLGRDSEARLHRDEADEFMP